MTRPSRLFLFILAVFALTLTSLAQDDPNSPRYTRTFNLTAGAMVIVENGHGSISVTGTDQSQATVEVIRHFEDASSEREKDMLRNTKVWLDVTGNRLRVKAEFPECWGLCWGGWEGGSPPLEFVLKIPRRSTVELNADRGPVTLTGITGDVRVSIDRGRADLADVEGNIRVNTDRGPVRMRAIRSRGIEIESDRGEVDLDLIEVGGPIRIESDRGPVLLRLPANSKFNLRVEHSRRSSLNSDFPITMEGRFREGHVTASINGGGPEISISNDRGPITIRKH